MRKLLAVKGSLWFLVGAAAAIAVFRFWRGIGPTTALTDLTPWGFWIGFDVMGGVALAAGGFVIAATVYVFHLERYHAIVRPAVLTAFLGYLAVAVGLLFDLGLPWNIWHMIIFWNPHSPLFEVGMCVMCYLTVLALEFAPVVLELAKHPFLQKIYFIVKKATVPLVILGIMFSSLHQSSLGSLFLIMPHRLHELWYTPILPILFFLSAIPLGLMMVTTESLVSSTLYESEYELPLLQGLGKACSWALWVYLTVRFGDLAVRGVLPRIFEGGFAANLFIVEILICGIIPAILLSIPAVRKSFLGLAVSAGITVVGFVMNRLDVGGLAMIETTGTRYIPSWMEVVISLGIVAGAALVFFFVAENFALMHGGPMRKDRFKLAKPKFHPATGVIVADPYWPGIKRYSFRFVLGAALAVTLMPQVARSGKAWVKQPVHPPAYGDKIVIDGNLNDKAVLFNHQSHLAVVEGPDSCAYCHHMVLTGAHATGCARCHQDQNIPTSIFDHKLHAESLKAGPDCKACHTDPRGRPGRPGRKDVEHTKPCLECHTAMIPEGAFVKLKVPGKIGLAPGYVDAMHGLCIPCHEKMDGGSAVPGLANCTTCHSGAIPAFDPLSPDQRMQALKTKAPEPSPSPKPSAAGSAGK